MSLLKVSVFGSSLKKHEKRVPIHPNQIEWIDPKLRAQLIFEEGYGIPFGMQDDQLSALVGGLAPRKRLFEISELMLMPKPVKKDFEMMREGSILWGWPHCVQQEQITQSAIDRKLTLIAWEAMHRWSKNGDWKMHIFQKNNEIAGYAGVLHAFSLAGINGNYGPKRKAVVLSFGSVSRGAIRGLKGLGIHDITIFTKRFTSLVADQMTGMEYKHFEVDENGNILAYTKSRQHTYPFIDELATADIIVNGILQDTDQPLMFVKNEDTERLRPGCLIIDISCDEGMGFEFAKPTTFDNPMFNVGKVNYYAVDHTPSYLWNSASWEISHSLLPYLPIVMAGPESWENNNTIRKAIEIQDGVIRNPKILTFQNRSNKYPHPIILGC